MEFREIKDMVESFLNSDKSFKEFVKDLDLLSEMANMRPKTTGLPMVIYVSEGVGFKHGPRIKVSQVYGDKINKFSLFSMTIEDEPKVVGDAGSITDQDIEMVKGFIKLNKKLLLDYWNNIIDIADVVKGLKTF